MSVGIVMVHGYTGSEKDLMPLAERLSGYYGAESVINLSLPFHDNDQVPEFDQQAFIKEIARAANFFLQRNKKLFFSGIPREGFLYHEPWGLS
ncbi:MAG: hypothetical protein PF503_18570 [Desulfobacula sp.]|jgi:ATP-dependent RNA circularization protein (DNA/RNA ligase family)|nr:hypothetical protein [Desulfobacula sp.]